MEKYKVIEQDIAQKIKSGVYAPGSQLPLENQLCETYKVSRITIKKATDQLVALGLITKRRGSGSYVKELSGQGGASGFTGEQIQFMGFTRQFAGRNVSTVVNDFSVVPASGEVAKKMILTEDNLVYKICRTRFLDGEPYVVEYTYMPVDTIPGINMKILQGSIYEHIVETLNLKPQSAHRTIRALLPTEEEKIYFQTDKPFSILEIEQIAYLDDGRIFEYSKAHHHGDKFSYRCVSIW